MLLLYTLSLTALGLARWVWAKLANRLETKFSRLCVQVSGLASEASIRPGNGNRPDAIQSARRMFELGKLVQKRDALEGRLLSRMKVAEKLGHWLNRLRAWKGKKLPYTLGALDIWLVLSAIDMAGMSQYFNARMLVEWVMTLFQV